MNSISETIENKNLTETEFAYVLGVMRDGHITKNRLEFYSNDKTWLLNISSMLQKLYNKNPLLREIKRYGHVYWKMQIEDKHFVPKLRKISGFKSPQSEWATPSIIINSPKEIQDFYISGFFDAEGSVDGHLKNTWNIALYQCWNNDIECPPLADIKEILLKSGIRSNKITVKTKNRKTPLFCLRITDKKSVKLFCEMIHSYHPAKLDKINRILVS